MKKKIALLLVACLTVASLTMACSKKEDKKETTTKETTTEEKTTEEKTTEEKTTEAEPETTAIVEGVTDNDDGSQTLGCLAWWAGTGIGKDYALTGDGSVTLKIETTDNTRAFSVELYNAGTDAAGDGYYVTTGSDGNAWAAELLLEGATVTSPFADNGNADPGKFVAGNTYEVTVTRAANDYTVVYKDAASGEEVYKMTVKATVEAPKDLNVHVMAQVGNVTVSEVK